MFESTKELIETFCKSDKNIVYNFQIADNCIDANIIITSGISTMCIQISSNMELIGEDISSGLDITFIDFRRYLDPSVPKFLSDRIGILVFETQFSEKEEVNRIVYNFSAKIEGIRISIKILINNSNKLIPKTESDLLASDILSYYDRLIKYLKHIY